MVFSESRRAAAEVQSLRPRRIRGPRVVADKNVAFKRGPAAILLHPDASRVQPGSPSSAIQPRGFHNPPPPPARICENENLTMTTENLLSLKDDMVAFIEGHGLHRLPGYVTDDVPSIVWEGQGNPDSWKDFVEMAKRVGAPFVTFSEMSLKREELDALIEEAGEMNFRDEESTDLVEAQWLRKYAGNVGYIQLGFVYQGLVFLHETTTEWYERFQALLEDVESFQDIVIDGRDRDEEDE